MKNLIVLKELIDSSKCLPLTSLKLRSSDLTDIKMNTIGYPNEMNHVSSGIPYHISSSGPVHHPNASTSFSNNVNHANGNITSSMNAHLPINKTIVELPKLPLSNHSENQINLCNPRQNSYITQNHISLPNKPCLVSPDTNNYFQFSTSNQNLGMLNLRPNVYCING